MAAFYFCQIIIKDGMYLILFCRKRKMNKFNIFRCGVKTICNAVWWFKRQNKCRHNKLIIYTIIVVVMETTIYRSYISNYCCFLYLFGMEELNVFSWNNHIEVTKEYHLCIKWAKHISYTNCHCRKVVFWLKEMQSL